MESRNKKLYVAIEVDIDTNILYGDIEKSAAYLRQLSREYKAKGFSKINLQECWTGYEDMKMILRCQRKETDREHSLRLNDEKEKEIRLERERKEKEEQKAQRAKDHKEFQRLKRIFS